MRLTTISFFIFFNICLIDLSNAAERSGLTGLKSEKSELVAEEKSARAGDSVYEDYEYLDEGSSENSITSKREKVEENSTNSSSDAFPNEVFLTLRNITADAASAFRSFTNRNDVADLQASASDNLNATSNDTFGDSLEAAGINLRALRDAGQPPEIVEESPAGVYLPYKHAKIDTADLSDCALQGEWKPMGVAHGHLHQEITVDGDNSHQAEILQSVGSYSVPSKVIPHWGHNLVSGNHQSFQDIRGALNHHNHKPAFSQGNGGSGHGFGGSGASVYSGGGSVGGVHSSSVNFLNHHHGGNVGAFANGASGHFQKIKSGTVLSPPPIPPIIFGKKPGYWKTYKSKHKFHQDKWKRPPGLGLGLGLGLGGAGSFGLASHGVGGVSVSALPANGIRTGSLVSSVHFGHESKGGTFSGHAADHAAGHVASEALSGNHAYELGEGHSSSGSSLSAGLGYESGGADISSGGFGHGSGGALISSGGAHLSLESSRPASVGYGYLPSSVTSGGLGLETGVAASTSGVPGLISQAGGRGGDSFSHGSGIGVPVAGLSGSFTSNSGLADGKGVPGAHALSGAAVVMAQDHEAGAGNSLQTGDQILISGDSASATHSDGENSPSKSPFHSGHLIHEGTPLRDSTFSSSHINQGLRAVNPLPDAAFLSSHVNQNFPVHGQGISDELSSSSTFTCGKNHDHNTNYHTATFQVADHDHPSSVDVLRYEGDAAVLIQSSDVPFHDQTLPERKHYRTWEDKGDAEASSSDNRNELVSQAAQLTGQPTEQEIGLAETEQEQDSDDGEEPERHSYYHEITKVTKIPATSVGSVQYTYSQYETKPQSFTHESESEQEDPNAEQPQIIKELEELSNKFQKNLENPQQLFDEPPSQELTYQFPFHGVELHEEREKHFGPPDGEFQIKIKDEGHNVITEYPQYIHPDTYNSGRPLEVPIVHGKKPQIKFITRFRHPQFPQKTNVNYLQPKPPAVIFRKHKPKQFSKKKQNYEVQEHGRERHRPLGEIFPPQKFPKQFHNPKPNFAVDRPKDGWRPPTKEDFYYFDISHGKKIKKYKTHKQKVLAPVLVRRPVSGKIPTPVIRVVEVSG